MELQDEMDKAVRRASFKEINDALGLPSDRLLAAMQSPDANPVYETRPTQDQIIAQLETDLRAKEAVIDELRAVIRDLAARRV